MALRFNKEITSELPSLLTQFECLKSYALKNITFTFSVYKNGIPGKHKSDYRNILYIKGVADEQEFRSSLVSLISEVPEGHELAFNSHIIINSKHYHIPLVDFSNKQFTNDFKKKITEFVNIKGGTLNIFRSGRSFHGYHDLLLSEPDWYHYIADLLFLNSSINSPRGRLPKLMLPKAWYLVDMFWIAHSLKQHFSALRLTCNTKAYIHKPTFHSKITSNHFEPKTPRT